MKRVVKVLILLILMGGFGVGVNRFIASKKTNLTAAPVSPELSQTLINLPGTIYLTQNGVLYALSNGHFAALHLPSTDAAGSGITWAQPALLPTGDLLAIARGSEYSDLYKITTTGHVVAQLTHDYVSADPNKIRGNHWISWPHVSPDEQSLWFSLDSPKPNSSYEVDFTVWSAPIASNPIVTANAYNANGKVAGTHWTTPDAYTGGDTDPNPLPGGSLLYVGYGIDNFKVDSTVFYQATKRSHSISLTTPAQDCNAAEVAPDGVTIVMVCSNNSQQTSLEVATLTGTGATTTLSTPKVLVDNCLCASPQWSPDGKSLLYYAPSDKTGHFQLWYLKNAAALKPAAPQQVTTNLDFDATSVPAWSSVVATYVKGSQ